MDRFNGLIERFQVWMVILVWQVKSIPPEISWGLGFFSP